jgi:hypothetical protein
MTGIVTTHYRLQAPAPEAEGSGNHRDRRRVRQEAVPLKSQ